MPWYDDPRSLLEGKSKAKEMGSDARPQGKREPQAYPLGYVEDSLEPRTQQMISYRSPRIAYAAI